MKWYVVKVSTNNGERIGISQEEEGAVLYECTSEEKADQTSKIYSEKLNIKLFDNNVEWLV